MIITGVVGSIAIVVMATLSHIQRYHKSPIFLLPILWAPYLLRRRVHLHPAHYVLFTTALLFHETGAFGFYQNSPFPFSFDIAVHFYFGMVGTIMIQRALRYYLPGHAFVATCFFALMLVMGTGALHEIMEYFSYLLFGEKGGMLQPSTSYNWDTARDLTNNLFGSITGLLLLTLYKFIAPPPTTTTPTPYR